MAAEYLTLKLGWPQLSSPSPAWSERTASLLGLVLLLILLLLLLLAPLLLLVPCLLPSPSSPRKMTTLFISAVGSEDPCLATLRMTLAFLRDLDKQQQYRGGGDYCWNTRLDSLYYGHFVCRGVEGAAGY